VVNGLMGRNGFPAESEEGHDEFVRVWRSGGESLLPKEPNDCYATICIYVRFCLFPFFVNQIHPYTNFLHNIAGSGGWK
jgi:hypothetical protein